MLSIEEYIARRKKEDKINEFDFDARTHNMKICVDYIFEYFNNYLKTTEAEEKTVLHSEKLEKYRKQLDEYEFEVKNWAVSMYDEYGKQVHRYIGNILKEDDLFFIYNTDDEFRSVSYDCYTKLIKKLPFIKEQTEMLFLFIKEYHRVQGQKHFDFGVPTISEEISDWLENTWTKHQVNLAAFAYNWINGFMIMKVCGLLPIGKKVSIHLESMTMIISRKATYLISIPCIEKCLKSISLKEENRNLKFYLCTIGFMILKVMMIIGMSIWRWCCLL